MKDQIVRYLSPFWDCSKFYLLWIFIHFAVANSYSYFCAYPSFMGFITSPFMTMAPHCKAMHWLLDMSLSTITNMWVVLGSWFSLHLIQNSSQ